MSEAFMAYVETLEPGSDEAAELMEAMRSQETLLAYAVTHDLALSSADAAFIAGATGPVDDTELDNLSGGTGPQLSLGNLSASLRSKLRSSSEP